MPKPDLLTVPVWYHNYIALAQGDEVLTAITTNTLYYGDFLYSIPPQKWNYAYAAGKWTVKEVILHLSDAERIFCYRALSFARGEKASLPGFDENTYAAASKANGRTVESLLNEAITVRESTEDLFTSFDEEQLSVTGLANNNTIGVAAIGFIIAGHATHHLKILKERYGV